MRALAPFLSGLIVIVAGVGGEVLSPFRRPGWTPSIGRMTGGSKSDGVGADRASATAKSVRGGHGDPDGDGDEDKRLVLIIDVDNTLYSEKDLLASTGEGIESQIVRNIHLFGLLHFNLTSDQCDELHRTHGSTIEGLRNALPPERVKETMAKFYREVYDPVDFSCLLGVAKEPGALRPGVVDEGAGARSGYDHGSALRRRRALSDFLASLARGRDVYLASNSPRAHVVRAVRGAGLGGVGFAGILAPDADGGTTSSRVGPGEVYPTKASPRRYYERVLERHPPEAHRIVLLDDSPHNLRAAASVGIDGVRVDHERRTLEEGLAEALGHILPSESDGASSDENYAFSDAEYLRAKNEVDATAIDPVAWEDLARRLARRLRRKADGAVRAADLGAGLLSMLALTIEGGGGGGGGGDRAKPSLLASVGRFLRSDGTSRDEVGAVTKLEYFAYESNRNLLRSCEERLDEMGFERVEGGSSGLSFSRVVDKTDVTIHLRPTDFRADPNPPEDIDLVVGCCFADLFDPDELALSLQRFVRGSSDSPPLVYFPITFAGATRFDRTLPPTPPRGPTGRAIPSDTAAFGLYSKSLADHGHNMEPALIAKAIGDRGGSLLTRGVSDWIIDPSSDRYLWETMMYFFGMSGARELSKHHLDAAGWIRRCRSNPRTIVVSNVDLLFSLGTDPTETDEGFASFDGTKEDSSTSVSAQEIQFVAPYNVTTVTKQWDTSDSKRLSPNQVEIQSLCSLISSGTELKIFKGSFESASLDVNIKGMADEAMEYPLAYGYSLVGRVVACGSNVVDADSLVGKLVFSFSPHSSRVIADRDAIQVVPDGISAEDAIFMPSVETALSLVHDAHVRLGENVAVFGQGLIGLLVTSILSMQSVPLASSSFFNTVTTFDTLDDRLRISARLGATNALKPEAAKSAGPFDVSIEVSGNPRALQSAIDCTSNNGRIVVGSWYGSEHVALKLGIDFHRSHKTIQTSQVSTIPPALAGLWDKERRFLLAWALVKSLKPSQFITKWLPLNDAQQAYDLLDKGSEIAICFKYD